MKNEFIKMTKISMLWIADFSQKKEKLIDLKVFL